MKSQADDIAVIQVKLIDFGKCRLLPLRFFEATKIPKKDITSAFYVENTIADFMPVNDKLFNYAYFNKYIYPSRKGKIVELTVKKYIINEKEIFVVIKIK